MITMINSFIVIYSSLNDTSLPYAD